MAVVAQLALLCPSGLDVWMQRELSSQLDDGSDRPRSVGRGELGDRIVDGA
jgi:hypothetical protein